MPLYICALCPANDFAKLQADIYITHYKVCIRKRMVYVKLSKFKNISPKFYSMIYSIGTATYSLFIHLENKL